MATTPSNFAHTIHSDLSCNATMDSFLHTGGENTMTVFLMPGHECHKALLDEGEEESLSDMCDYFHSVFWEVCPHIYILIQRNDSGTEHSATDISSEHGSGRILLDNSEPKGDTVAGFPHRDFLFLYTQCASHGSQHQLPLEACDRCRPTTSEPAM